MTKVTRKIFTIALVLLISACSGGSNRQAEMSPFDALMAIEAYNNGDGIAPKALTLEIYEIAGMVGVSEANLEAINASVLDQISGGADSKVEIQALVDRVLALAVIQEFANGDGVTPPPLTIAQYEAAGILGVTASNLSAMNATVLAKGQEGANTAEKIDAMVKPSSIAVIETYNNGDGTTPPALTVTQYTAAGVIGVTSHNLAAVNAAVLSQATAGADTEAEIQTLVDRVNALAVIEAYNNGDGTPPTALTLADYTDAGITGVTSGNLAAVNAAVLAQAAAGADAEAEIQALVDRVNALAGIEAYNNGDGTAPAALTLADYTDAGITGVTSGNLAAVNAAVLAQATAGADAEAEIQALVDRVNALAGIEAYNNGNGTTPAALTLADYTDAGITGVTSGNLAAVNAAVLAQATAGADTEAEIQALVNAIRPVLTETAVIGTVNVNTPTFTFNSTISGTITYGGSCSGTTTAATENGNSIVFNRLADGTYSNCTLTVTQSAGTASLPLNVTDFKVATIASKIIYSDIDGDGTDDTIITGTFNTDGSAIQTLSDTDANGSTEQTINYTYDADGKVTASTTIGTNDSVSTYTYNADGTPQRIDTDMAVGTDFWQIYTYDASLRAITLSAEANVGVDIYLYMDFYTLDDEGNRIQTDRDFSNNGSIGRVWTRTYNANRDILVATEDTNNDGTVNAIETKTYDAYHNVLTFEDDDDGDPNTVNTTYTTEYTYDLSGNVLTSRMTNDADGTVALIRSVYTFY